MGAFARVFCILRINKIRVVESPVRYCVPWACDSWYQSHGWLLRVWPSMRYGDVGASTTNNGNSIFIMENSDSGGFETLETPNIFLYPSILSLVTILIWSCFIIERFVLKVQVVVSLFNLERFFRSPNKSCYFLLEIFSF